MTRSMLRRWRSHHGRNRSVALGQKIQLQCLEKREVPALYTVDLLSDDGSLTGTNSGDLRYCIEQANANSGLDTITFDAKVFASQETITLNNGELIITDDLDLDEPPERVTIDVMTKGNNRIFHIVDSIVEMTNLRMTLANYSGDGAGVYVDGGELTLNDCLIDHNTAGGDGGGIWATDATITLTDTLLENNSAGGNGGGIYADNVVLDIHGGAVSQSIASNGSGGGLYLDGGTFSLTTSQVDRSYATKSNGGNIFLSDGDLSITGTVLDLGIAKSGGGIFAANGTLDIGNSTITENSGFDGAGGGIHTEVPTTITGTLFQANGSLIGGGINVFGSDAWLDMEQCEFYGNGSPFGEDGQGGGIRLHDVSTSTTSSIRDTVVGKFENGNHADAGGGIAIIGSGNSEFLRCNIIENSGYVTGGGVYIHAGGAILIDSCTMDKNIGYQSGGGITINCSAGVVVQNSTISNNQTSFDDPEELTFGAGIYFPQGGSNDIINTTICANVAELGGGIYFKGSSSTDEPAFYNCTVFENTAQGQTNGGSSTPGVGGGFYLDGLVEDVDALKLDSTIVALNVANDSGNGPDIYGPDADVEADFSFVSVADSGGFNQEPSPWVSLTGMQVGSASMALDPLLQQLGDYGGPTRTHAPQSNSPVLDVGQNTLALDYDQRGSGFDREVKALSTSTGKTFVDIGAVELQRWAQVTALDTYAENKNQKSLNVDNHSRITSMVVVFSEAVELPATPEDAFELVGLTNNKTTVSINVTQSVDGKSVTIRFLSHTDSNDTYTYPSLADDNYQLTIDSSLVISFGAPLDGDGDGYVGGNYATPGTGSGAMYRFFGDAVNNNRAVTSMDYVQFLAAYGTQGATFDWNGDGDVNAVDYNAFRLQYGLTLATP